MARPVVWREVVVVVVAVCHVATACNVRDLSEIIQNRFRQEVVSSCGALGEKCTFDRDCCKGLECKMSASMAGLGNYCQEKFVSDPERADIENALWESGEVQPANEPSSPEDGYWMVARSEDDYDNKEVKEDDEEDNAQRKHFDTLSEIQRLQEKKRKQLVKENEELEKLFTEKDETELAQLRVLKEDAEMDELRRLKELRLKRKLQLIKELQELRGLKDENNLDKINKLKSRTEATEVLVSTTPAEAEEEMISYNVTGSDNESKLEARPAELSPEPQEEFEQTAEPEITTVHLKQGVHEMHHRKKHHQPKHKRKLSTHIGNSTTQYQETRPMNKDMEYAEANKTDTTST